MSLFLYYSDDAERSQKKKKKQGERLESISSVIYSKRIRAPRTSPAI